MDKQGISNRYPPVNVYIDIDWSLPTMKETIIFRMGFPHGFSKFFDIELLVNPPG